MIRNNLRSAVSKSGLIIKDIASKSGVKKRTIDKWLGKEGTEPKAIDLYKVCVALGVSMEEIVDGEQGIAYLRLLIEKEQQTWKQHGRISSIVKILEKLDEPTLKILEKMILPLKITTLS